jgi:molybdenum cofactor biosynthesis enzyme MoaA
MKQLRLLLFEACDKTCSYCANDEHALDDLPVVESFAGYDRVMITGGEPMLRPDLVAKVIADIRREAPHAMVYMYTARVNDWRYVLDVLDTLDGLTVSLHRQEDVAAFHVLDAAVEGMRRVEHFGALNKSMRLKVFEGVNLRAPISLAWQIEDVYPTQNCPVPQGEDFMRLTAKGQRYRSRYEPAEGRP